MALAPSSYRAKTEQAPDRTRERDNGEGAMRLADARGERDSTAPNACTPSLRTPEGWKGWWLPKVRRPLQFLCARTQLLYILPFAQPLRPVSPAHTCSLAEKLDGAGSFSCAQRAFNAQQNKETPLQQKMISFPCNLLDTFLFPPVSSGFRPRMYWAHDTVAPKICLYVRHHRLP